MTWPADEASIHLFVLYDGIGTVPLFLAIIGAWFWLSRESLSEPLRAFARAVGRQPEKFALGFALIAAALCLPIYQNTTLSFDEYAELFQARIFAHGHWHGQFPPALIKRLSWTNRGYFLAIASDGKVMESYWPGFSLLLAPFAFLRAPWLLNPLLGGAIVWLLGRWLREARQDEETIGWAVLFLLASPVFWANSLSFYSMNARLLANLAFAFFLLRAKPRDLFLAGLCGGFACFLHNPFHHAVFALPWLVDKMRAPGRARTFGWLFLGYLPWLLPAAIWSHQLLQFQHGWTNFTTVADVKSTVKLPTLDRDTWHYLALNFLKMNAWLAPALLALAALGFRRARGPLRLLGWSFVVTYLSYAWIPSRWVQGFGWGHRYSYGALVALPVLAALALRDAAGKRGGGERATALWLVAAGLLVAVPVRLWQMREFIAEQNQTAACLPENVRQVCFIDPWHGYYAWDRVQNDPFLEAPRINLLSRQPDLDAHLMKKYFPGYELKLSTEAYRVWTPRP